MEEYLKSTKYINYENSGIAILATALSTDERGDTYSKVEITKKCFEWVRDNIRHSAEFKLNPITCKASDVLAHKTGYCFAKSHLLAALLRANEIPTGLCYQRLCMDDKGESYSLHGLNAVFLEEFGWYRLDPRGNNRRVNAQFIPPKEQLAFPVSLQGEVDLPEILSEPRDDVIAVLERCQTYQEVMENLPDIEVFESGQ